MTDLIVVPQAAHFRTGVVVAHWCWGPIFQEYFWPACVFAKFDMSVSTNAGSYGLDPNSAWAQRGGEVFHQRVDRSLRRRISRHHANHRTCGDRD